MLRELLKRDYVILDGAMGTNLFRKGLTAGECPESWNIENPEKIFEIHEGFVDAGSDIIVTNTFGGNQFRLKLHQLETKVKEPEKEIEYGQESELAQLYEIKLIFVFCVAIYLYVVF